MLQFKSLKSRISILFILLLIAVQAVSFFATNSSNERLEVQQTSSQLSLAEKLLRNELNKTSFYLIAFAETVAKDYGLKQVLAEDTRSLLVALNNHRNRINADISLAFNEDGMVIGELMVVNPDSDQKKVVPGGQINTEFTHKEWLSNSAVSVYYQLKNQVYLLVIAPIISGDIVIGHIGFGYSIDNKLANAISESTGFSVGFGLTDNSNWQWVALSNTEIGTSASTTFDTNFSPLDNNISKNYVFTNYSLGSVDKLQLVATTYQLRSSLVAAIKQDSSKLILIISITMILSLLGAYIIASGLTQPLRQLVTFSSNIEKGDYKSSINVGSTEEMNRLAVQFEKMQHAIKEREAAITAQAFLDSLSSLPNRNQFNQDLLAFKKPFLLCQISIRRLADINDTLGHEVGDKVILEVANRLKGLNKPLYQISGNAFLIRCDHESVDDAKECVSKINSVIEPLFVYQNIALHLQINIGVSQSDGYSNINQVLKEVDAAMHIAKRKNLLFQLYNQQIDINTLDRLQLINRLKLAIENDELTLYYQPKLNLKKQVIEGVEALVRWNHPINGLLTPDAFIHIAEQTGQMNSLTKWVLNQAINQLHLWQMKGLALKIAINISPENILDEDFCVYLINILCDKRELYKSISLEITEDSFLDHSSKAVENITMLRNNGIYLSIDDYGTGYSSLAQLRNIPVEELKIDRCFIKNLTAQDIDQYIVSSTIKLAHKLDLTVVAEGVEDQATLNWLTEHGCEKVQGYFISKPLPDNEFEQWLANSIYSTEIFKTTKITTNETNKNSNIMLTNSTS